ncbi:hypothetical protein IMSAGC013_02450 [Lachnospiraceae bacterium]|nr:hypothetical protein IMSAGC013_02450 [Lachnospiraceae bacterium]
MITVNVMELFLKSAELLADGYEKVELLEIDGDKGTPASLSFSALDEINEESIDYESIDDCLNDEKFSISFSPGSIAPYPMTLDDLFLIAHALQNAIENCKTALDDKSISAELRSEITDSIKRFDSFYNNLSSFLREFQ